jgi:putative cell wall-binding protein
LKPAKIYVAGGERVIAAGVIEQLNPVCALSGESIVRLSGSNRYETSVKIAQAFYPAAEELYLATGEHFLEPLAAGALAAAGNSCLLLISPLRLYDQWTSGKLPEANIPPPPM